MTPYRFRALITPALAAGDGAAPGHPGGTHGCWLIQPGHSTCFPAVISPDQQLTTRATWQAVVSTALASGEAVAFFTPGQRFTIWADVIVGETIQARGLIGHGIIGYPISPPAPQARDHGAARKKAGAARGRSPTALRVPAA